MESPTKGYYIAVIYCPPEIEAKIHSKHNVTLHEVREAALFNSGGVWDEHPMYGGRLLVQGTTYERRHILSILKPLDETDGVWELRTALSLTS